MNDTIRVKIYTRSMSPILYHRAMALVNLPYDRVRLTGTTADGYLFQMIADESADYVINIDEDAFVCNGQAMVDLIEYCQQNEYINCGMPDGGVVPLRDGNPLVTNPFFNIMNTRYLRDALPSFVQETPNRERFAQNELLVGNHDFAATNTEPYYPLLIWMANHCKTLYLNAYEHSDGESTVLYNHTGEPFLIHTWYSRFYNRDLSHTRRIDKAFNEACQLQGIQYTAPIADTINALCQRTYSQTLRVAVNIKRRCVKP